MWKDEGGKIEIERNERSWKKKRNKIEKCEKIGWNK